MATNKAYASFASVPKFSEQVVLDPSNVPAGQVSVETFAVPGLKTGLITLAEAPSLETGLVLVNAYCAANNVLTLVIWNPSVAAVNGASQTVYVVQI